MQNNTKLKAAAVAVSVLALLAVAPVQAQNTAAQSSSSSSDGSPSQEDLENALTMSIGCIATYDMILAKGAGAKTAKITTARDFARQMYTVISGETDQQVADDIKVADPKLADALSKDGTSAAQLETTCDSLFMDDGSSSAAPGKS